MKIQQFQPVFRSDVPKSEPWIEQFLKPVYDQIKDLTVMSQGQWNFSDNANAEERELDVVHNEEFQISLKRLRGKPDKVLLGAWDSDEFAWPLRWKIIDIDKISCRVKFETDPGRPVKVKILVIGK